jgi:hypothetical protein
MTLRSIIDIDVNSKEFEQFVSMFNRYNAALQKQPKAWQEISRHQNAATAGVREMTDEEEAENEVLRKRHTSDERRLKNLGKMQTLWESIHRSSTGLYRNVVGVGEGILKWGGILLGAGIGVATGSLFGFDRLASGVGSARREAKGLGMSIGQASALGIDFGRLADTGQLAQAVLGMETNYGARAPWYALGLGAMSGNTAQDMVRLLAAERAWAKRTPLGLLGPLGASLGLPSSTQDLMRLRGTSNAEFQQISGQYLHDVNALNISDRAGRSAQNVQAQFERVGKEMQTALWGAIGRLAGPVTRLSQAFTHAAIQILGSPAVKRGIENLSSWMTSFAKDIDTGAFDTKIKNFMADVGVVADGIGVLAHVLAKSISGIKSLGDTGPAVYSEARAGQNWMWGLGTQLKNFFTGKWSHLRFANGIPQLTPGQAADWYGHIGATAAALRSANLAGVSSQTPITSAAPQIRGPALGTAPLSVLIQNMTGGSAVVSVNGLAGTQ